MRRARLFLTLLALAAALAPWGALRAGDCAGGCSASNYPSRTGVFSSVTIQPDDSVPAGVVDGAIGMWNGCSANGGKFPQLGTGSTAPGYHISVHYQTYNASGDRDCGVHSGNDITIFGTTEVGGKPFGCGDPQVTLAHEIGHWLGLADSPECAECAHDIMSWIFPDGSNREGRAVQPSDCQTVDEHWKMPGEQGGPDAPGHIGGLHDICDLVPEVCQCEVGCDGTEPWWMAGDTTPTLECVTTTSFFGIPYRAESTTTCEYHFAPVRRPTLAALADGDAFTVSGPTVGVFPPSGPVSDGWTFTGWATQGPAGVARVAFWIDEQPTSLVPVMHLTSGQACAGDPACPNVGFSATLDTRTLANGTHLLTVVAASAATTRPGASRFDISFEVANCLDTTPPAISWTAPASGTTVSGPVTIQAAASDDVGVTRVEFFLDNSRIGSDTAAPFAMTWNPAGVAAGSHQLKARAFDACGNFATSAVATVNLFVDTAAPAASLTSPAGGSLLRGVVGVSASASDNVGVSRVDFLLDGAVAASDATAPYAFSWNTTAAAAGAHTLSAKAYDAAGNSGTSAPVSVIVDNTAPRAWVDAPAGNATVQGAAVAISGWATDATRIASLSFQLDGAALPLNAPYTYGIGRGDVCSAVPVGDPSCPYVGFGASFDATRFANGSHTLTVVATDSAGNPFSASRTFTIGNPPPPSPPAAPSGLAASYSTTTRTFTLTWVDNSNNETSFEPQFSYSGSAFSDLGNVGANVTTFVSGPNPPTGSYQFRVRALNGGLASAWTATVSLVVSNPQPTTSIAWIQPAESSWGPAGTLTAAGYAANGSGGVTLVWRERSSAGVWGGWNTVAYTPPPSADTTWSNTISSGNPTNKCHWFDAYTVYSGVTSTTFHYTGTAGCP